MIWSYSTCTKIEATVNILDATFESSPLGARRDPEMSVGVLISVEEKDCLNSDYPLGNQLKDSEVLPL